MKVLLLDNYDSFTYNLYHYLNMYCGQVDVVRNDEISLAEINTYSHIVISPGPGLPRDAGITMDLLEMYADKKSILGVCLGCQALAQHFGGELYNQNQVAHGIARTVKRENKSWLLQGLAPEFAVGLYHSWAIKPTPLLKNHFGITAWRESEILMAMEHHSLALAGVQFHPESVMTDQGYRIIQNWLMR